MAPGLGHPTASEHRFQLAADGLHLGQFGHPPTLLGRQSKGFKASTVERTAWSTSLATAVARWNAGSGNRPWFGPGSGGMATGERRVRPRTAWPTLCRAVTVVSAADP